jgi:hypothetical protein
MKLTKSVVIHGYQFRKALDYNIRLCPEMGKHTGVIHIAHPIVEKYVWGHKIIQPWGERMPLQCCRCGVLDPWGVPVFKKSSERFPQPSYSMQCKNANCGRSVNGGGNRERHSFKIFRPPVFESLGSGDFGWLRVPL